MEAFRYLSYIHISGKQQQLSLPKVKICKPRMKRPPSLYFYHTHQMLVRHTQLTGVESDAMFLGEMAV